MSKSASQTNIDKNIETSQETRVQINHVSDSLTLLLYLGLLIVTILTVWLFKHRRFRFIHETGLAILYGLIVGIIIRYGSASYKPSIRKLSIEDSPDLPNHLPPEKVLVNMSVLNESQIYEYDYKRRLYGNNINAPILDEKATFNPEVFFNIILPPIIFFAGFSMKRKHFFRNIGSILTLAFLGTTVSCFVIGGIVFGISRASARLAAQVSFSECLLFGAFISATDPASTMSSSGNPGSKKNIQEAVNRFNMLRDEQRQISMQINQLEMEAREHNLVIDVLQKVEPNRKCYRMVGGVLVERSAGEVQPVLASNRDNMLALVEQLKQRLEAKGRELNEFKEKHGIRLAGERPSEAGGGGSDKADGDGGSSGGVLVA